MVTTSPRKTEIMPITCTAEIKSPTIKYDKGVDDLPEQFTTITLRIASMDLEDQERLAMAAMGGIDVVVSITPVAEQARLPADD